MENITEKQIVNSALWAAYGDVLGFPTELISERDFIRRNNLERIETPIQWKKRIGGLFGPEIPFEAGTYSDDTQLRLCVSRAIRGDGYFDVESFAKIELPVWLNYALGAGRGSKAAATNLALRESSWSQNFFQVSNSTYVNGGGNGAAMRIQPHVWANHKNGSTAFMADIVRDSICTHGHPRAIVGAAIHAGFLDFALKNRQLPPIGDWSAIGETAAIQAYEALADDEELSLVWIPHWQNVAKRPLQEAWAKTVLEWHESVDRVTEICAIPSSSIEKYTRCLRELGGYSDEERGSGLKTVLFAALACFLFRDENPSSALIAVANCFKSDTDTIATMAGALVGAYTLAPPPGPIQDEPYIKAEASRLYRIGTGEKQASFSYPDLLNWIPPRNQSDSWLNTAESSILLGLGDIQSIGDTYKATKGADVTWQWGLLGYGQKVLGKYKNSRGSNKGLSSTIPKKQDNELGSSKPPASLDMPLFEAAARQQPEKISLDALTQRCINSGFEPNIVGMTLLEICDDENGIENAIGFAAIIAKAKLARRKR